MKGTVMKCLLGNTKFQKFLVLLCVLFYAPTPVKAAEDPLDLKLNIYIRAYNELDRDARSSIKRYSSWVKSMKVGPTGREKVVYGLYRLSTKDIMRRRRQISELQEITPHLALDAAGVEYIEALRAFNEVVEKMYPYYEREDYKDDRLAKGKQLHIQYVKQMTLFLKASDQFALALNEENDKRLDARLTQPEDRNLTSLNLATIYEAKLLVRLFANKRTPIKKIVAKLKVFEKAADEAIRYAKKNPNELPDEWSDQKGKIEDFRQVAKERMRRIRDRTPYSYGDRMMIKVGSGWMIEGTLDKVVKVYNELIEQSNDLIQPHRETYVSPRIH
jgi:hypothetical protein